MLTGARHLLSQRHVLAALGGTVREAAATRLGLARRRAPVPLPGPELEMTLRAPPPALVQQYVRHVGGEPAAYRDRLPPHLFPQWTVPLAAKVLRGLPYPMLKVVNAGCRVTIHAPVPAEKRLVVRGQLLSITEEGDKAILRQRLVTGSEGVPAALEIELTVIAPLHAEGKPGQPRGDNAPGAARNASATHKAGGKLPARVPDDARELGSFRLGPDAGLTFGFLTGDLNPLHWARPYARAFGFRSPILHGFATLARAIEGLHRWLYAGRTDRLGGFEVRFTRPLVLPARVGLYIDPAAAAGSPGRSRNGGTSLEAARPHRARGFYVGDAPGGPAYLVGSFWERTP